MDTAAPAKARCGVSIVRGRRLAWRQRAAEVAWTRTNRCARDDRCRRSGVRTTRPDDRRRPLGRRLESALRPAFFANTEAEKPREARTLSGSVRWPSGEQGANPARV